jgi:hypothetical protein
MKHHTRRRQQAGSMLSFFDSKEDTFDESKARIESIIANVATTRNDLQAELMLYEKKMTVLETEFNQYQELAQRVMSALDILDGATNHLVTPQSSPQGVSQATPEGSPQATPQLTPPSSPLGFSPTDKKGFFNFFSPTTPTTPQTGMTPQPLK